MTSTDSCRIGGIEDGCDSLLMLVCGSVGGGEPLWESNGLPWEHFIKNQLGGGGRRGRNRRPNLVGKRGKRQRQNT